MMMMLLVENKLFVMELNVEFVMDDNNNVMDKQLVLLYILLE